MPHGSPQRLPLWWNLPLRGPCLLKVWMMGVLPQVSYRRTLALEVASAFGSGSSTEPLGMRLMWWRIGSREDGWRATIWCHVKSMLETGDCLRHKASRVPVTLGPQEGGSGPGKPLPKALPANMQVLVQVFARLKATYTKDGRKVSD